MGFVDGSICRFNSVETAAEFIACLKTSFPVRKSKQKKSFFAVSRAPLSALVVLLVAFVIGMVGAPALNYATGRRAAVGAMIILLASVPKPVLVVSHLVLSGIAVGNAVRLWRRSTKTERFCLH
jgi:hypothetical protein